MAAGLKYLGVNMAQFYSPSGSQSGAQSESQTESQSSAQSGSQSAPPTVQTVEPMVDLLRTESEVSDDAEREAQQEMESLHQRPREVRREEDPASQPGSDSRQL